MSLATLDFVSDQTDTTDHERGVGVQDRWVPAQHFDTAFKEVVSRQISQLIELKPGWDGYKAPQIDRKIIQAAGRFVLSLREHFAPRPAVVPTPDGGLQLEWRRGDKLLEFEFENATSVHFLRWNPTAGVEEEDYFDASNVTLAEELITWFVQADGR